MEKVACYSDLTKFKIQYLGENKKCVTSLMETCFHSRRQNLLINSGLSQILFTFFENVGRTNEMSRLRNFICATYIFKKCTYNLAETQIDQQILPS